jgi:hypothetical protein
MAFVIADRVRETSTTTGIGPLTLLGPLNSNFRSFASGIGVNNSTFYVAVGRSTGLWETGIGTLDNTGIILTRTSILAGSNGTSPVNFTADVYDIVLSQPAEGSVYAANSQIVAPSGATLPVSSGGTGSSVAATALSNLGGLPIAGGVSMTGLFNLYGDATTNLQPVTLQQLNAVIAGGEYKAACYVATTANLTATFLNNGGVGDTLTNSGALAAFSSDGITPSVGSRVLVWNQTTASQNGIYELTNAGSGTVAWVLTRATDYNSVTQMHPGDLVPIEYGTIYGNAVLMQINTIVTVDVTAINFQIFNQPSSYLMKTGGTVGFLTANGNITAQSGGYFAGPGTGLTGTAAGLSIGGTAGGLTGTSLTGDVSNSGGIITLANTGVVAGSYTSANIAVDSKGRVTAAANGSGGGGGGNGGTTVSSISANLVLTYTSTRLQEVTATAVGLVVELPAANTITTEGGPVFVIKNSGTTIFGVTNSGGIPICAVDAGQTVLVFLVDNTTVNGVWSFGNATANCYALETIFGATPFSNTVAPSQLIVTAAISPTEALCVYQNGTTTFLEAVVLTISGTNVTFGTATVINGVNAAYLSVCALSATSFVVSYQNTVSTFLEAVVLTVAGTVVTAGAVTVCNAVNTNYVSSAGLTATTGIVTYQNLTSTFLEAVVLTVSGTTITVGTIKVCNAVSSPLGVAVAVSPTSVGVFYFDGTNSFLGAVSLAIAGTTITAGTPVDLPPPGTNNVNPVLITASIVPGTTGVLVSYQLNTGGVVQLAVFAVTSTSVIINTAAISLPSIGSGLPQAMVCVSKSMGYFTYRNVPEPSGYCVPVVMDAALGFTTGILPGVASYAATQQSAMSLTLLSSSQILATYQDQNTGFVGAQILEVITY